MKKAVLIILIVVLVLGAAGVGGFLLLKEKKTEEEEIPQDEGVLIETPLEERPYVTMTPREDGREFTLDISRIKNADTIEYELVYDSNGLSRGVVGTITLKGENKVTRQLLLGTCSRGKCKYDEDVSEGSLTLRFRSDEGVRKFDADFHLQRGDEVLTTIDDSFSLEGSFGSAYYLTMQTIGLPGDLMNDTYLAGPYGVFTAGSQSVNNGQVSVALEDHSQPTWVYAWVQKDWQILDNSETEGSTVTAPVTNLGTFMAAIPPVKASDSE